MSFIIFLHCSLINICLFIHILGIMDVKQPSSAASDILSEFVHVMLHGILFTREIYPQGAFERRKMYGVPVQICSHPGVASYIDGVVEMVHRMLDAGTVHQVVVRLTDTDMKPMETFTLEIGRCAKGISSASYDDLFLLQQNLRATLLKLYVCNGLLQTLPCECTWTVEVHTRRSTSLEIDDKYKVNDMMWVMEDNSSSSDDVDSKIIPLKSISTDILTMQLYVQELNASSA